ncbi:Hypothetical protein FKW44_016814 [Caligus rogercresseyi]|uniref:Uncharacterized protein n=1 Tax=Caligus rogercresseyi TaxID=217165 RepID=A0A7T8K0Q8_CALRO|nr:Hypothetical protein FKW44_016814 [Caligus rogercresseyi]
MFVEKQRKNAEFLANAIKRLVLSFLDGEELALVAAVNGEATDLGVSMLPFWASSLPRTRPRSVPPTDTTNDWENSGDAHLSPMFASRRGFPTRRPSRTHR